MEIIFMDILAHLEKIIGVQFVKVSICGGKVENLENYIYVSGKIGCET
jgi:hypothetical protein